MSVFVGSGASLAAKPAEVRTFLSVLSAANDYANDPAHHDEIVRAILAHTKLDEKTAQSITFWSWDTGVDPAKVQEVGDALKEFGVFDQVPAPDSIIDTQFLPSPEPTPAAS